MTLRTKLFASKLSLAIVPVILVATVAIWQSNAGLGKATTQTADHLTEIVQDGRDGLIAAGMTDLAHTAKNVFNMCQAQQAILQRKVDYDLNVARDVLSLTGPVTFSEETAAWSAINQYTKKSDTLALPKMLVGETWLGQNTEMSSVSPIVDKVQELVGGTCTIFQRMNEAGDMLRVCTNVEKLDGTRAVGTYIPAVNPDGSPNPVVSTIMRGETFRGRAYVVNAWYVTAYEPILDASGDVAGVLYVGVKEQSTDSVRNMVMSIEVGKTGYVYVLDSTGHYVISKGGARDGEDISQAKDPDGRYFIQEICALAKKLSPGQVGEYEYPWQNKGEAEPRMKMAKIAYFEPWDWVIGVSAYLDEFYETADHMDEHGREMLAAMGELKNEVSTSVTTWCGGIALGAALLATIFAAVIVRGVTKPINTVIAGLTEGAEQVDTAAGQVATSSSTLAEGASLQAQSLQESTTALEEVSSMSRTNAENARRATQLSGDARDAAHSGDQTMGKLNHAMTGINESATEISKIIGVIEEIAFQTNLLALNAAVEAARAGEHGKGFAVVADEVRNLAQRAAQAARETTTLIEDSVDKAKEGSEVAGEASKSLAAIVQNVTEVTDLIDGIASASQEQAQGIEQANSAISQMDSVTQQNASSAEESAAAAEQLSAQAQGVKSMVDELVRVVGRPQEGVHVPPESFG